MTFWPATARQRRNGIAIDNHDLTGGWQIGAHAPCLLMETDHV
jgi:hypothetical protein